MLCKNCGREIDPRSEFCPFCGNKVSVPEKGIENNSRKKIDKQTIIIIALIAAILCAAAAVFFLARGGGGDEAATQPTDATAASEAAALSEPELLYHDVNFSQCWKHDGKFSKEGVEVLLLVYNNGEQAINRCEFTYSIDGETDVKNLDPSKAPFSASGYIPPYSLGYMYGRIFLPDNTAHEQGEVTPTKFITCETKDEYAYPAISDLKWFDEGYKEYGAKQKLYDVSEWNFDCTVTNENEETISAENAVIIAAPDLDDMSKEAGAPVFGKWAAGKLKKDLPPNKSVKIEHALEKPQFDIGLIEFSQSDLGIYVIETK